MVDRGDGTDPNTGIAAIDALLPQVQNLGGLSLPALSLPNAPNTATVNASGPLAIPRVITGSDGLPHTVYVDAKTGQIVPNLQGYQVLSADGTVMQVPATTSVPVDTGSGKPSGGKSSGSSFGHNGSGALDHEPGAPTGMNNMSNFGPAMKGLSMIPGGALIAGAMELGKFALDPTPPPAPSTEDPNSSRFSKITGIPSGLGTKALAALGLTPGFAARALDNVFGVGPSLPPTAPTPYSPPQQDQTTQTQAPQATTQQNNNFTDPSVSVPGAPGSPEQPSTPSTSPNFTPGIPGIAQANPNSNPSPSQDTPSPQDTGTSPASSAGFASPTGPNDVNNNGAYGPDMGFGWGGTNSTTDPWGGYGNTPAASPETSPTNVGNMGTPAGMSNTVDGSPDNYGGYSSPSGNNNGRGASAYFSNSAPAIGNEPNNPVGNISPVDHQSIVTGNPAPENVGQGLTQAQTNLGTAAEALGMGNFSDQDKAAMAMAAIGEMSPADRAGLAANNPEAQATFGNMVASMMTRAQDPAIGSISKALQPGQYNSLMENLDGTSPLANTNAAFSKYGPVALANVNALTLGQIPNINYSVTNYYDPATQAAMHLKDPSKYKAIPAWDPALQAATMIGRTKVGTLPEYAAQTPAQTLANKMAFEADYGAAGDYQAGSYSPAMNMVSNFGYGTDPAFGNFSPSPDYSGGAYSPALGSITNFGYGTDPGWGTFAGVGNTTPDYGGNTYTGGFGDTAQRDNQDTNSYGGWGGYGGNQSSTSSTGGYGDAGYGGGGYNPGGMNSPSNSSSGDGTGYGGGGYGDGSSSGGFGGYGGNGDRGYGGDGSDNGNGSGGGYGGENGDTGGGGAGTRGDGNGGFGGL